MNIYIINKCKFQISLFTGIRDFVSTTFKKLAKNKPFKKRLYPKTLFTHTFYTHFLPVYETSSLLPPKSWPKKHFLPPKSRQYQ